jgi:hypothetical protein
MDICAWRWSGDAIDADAPAPLRPPACCALLPLWPALD